MVLQNELKDASRIPLKDRLAWTIPQAASLYGIDYDGLRQAVNQGDIDTFRPPSKRGTPSRVTSGARKWTDTSNRWRSKHERHG